MPQEIPQAALEKLERIWGLIQNPSVAQRVWEEHFTPQDRYRLGGNLEKAYAQYKTDLMWAVARGVSQPRALIELALELGFHSPATTKFLLQAIGETAPIPGSERPAWNRNTGQLFFRGQRVRRVASPGRAKNIVMILDCFEEEGWPERIDDPLPKGSDSQRLREAVRTLNLRLKRIRFRADGNGMGIVWVVTNTRAAPAPRR